MKITVRDSTTVLPSSETPQHRLWISNLDCLIVRSHVPTVYFYRPDGSNNFFDTKLMKESLGRALVPFYPIAGRLRHGDGGRLEIDCNGRGVLFVEAVAEGRIEDFEDFAPSMELMHLIPSVDYTDDVSSYPLFVLQVTFFKCGGVCLGVGMQHTLADGIAALHFLNSWSDIARGMDVKFPPAIDRACLRARDPPRPVFDHHTEYQPRPPMKTKVSVETLSGKSQNIVARARTFKFSKDQLARLKHKAGEGDQTAIKYSSFELLAGHLWRCVSMSRGLEDDQETTLYIAIDGRSRLRPGIPDYYFGNVVFIAAPVVVAGHLTSKPVHYAASKVHDAVLAMNDEYLRSAIDYLEVQPDLNALVRCSQTFSSPNVNISSWVRLPIYEADFGWGRPIYMGPAALPAEGSSKMLPSPSGDGSILVVIALKPDQLSAFEKLIYDV